MATGTRLPYFPWSCRVGYNISQKEVKVVKKNTVKNLHGILENNLLKPPPPLVIFDDRAHRLPDYYLNVTNGMILEDLVM